MVNARGYLKSEKAISLADKIANKSATIGVVGLGYVGLPLALLFAKKGFLVIGFVKNEKRAKELNNGITSLGEAQIEKDLKNLVSQRKFFVKVSSPESFKECDVIIVCVPTPVDEAKKPDITDLRQVAKALSLIDVSGKLIINESTVAPFTTQEVFGNLGKDYFLVCSPERIDPGNRSRNTETIAKIVGGKDKVSTYLGKLLYEQIVKEPVVEVSSMEVAEMSKMLENTYRSVNVALINEFAKLADALNIDILEVIETAKTKWSFHPHYPGIGTGGHCIPVDPYYILQLAKSRGLSMGLVNYALKENEEMPAYTLGKILKVYKKGAKILVYGLSYKKNVKDLRESPVITLCNLLRDKNVPFCVYDPLVGIDKIRELGYEYSDIKKVDIFVVGTDHDSLSEDYRNAIDGHTVVIDGRNYFKNKVGKKVFGIGRNIV